jgi:hypothetical protein
MRVCDNANLYYFYGTCKQFANIVLLRTLSKKLSAQVHGKC